MESTENKLPSDKTSSRFGFQLMAVHIVWIIVFVIHMVVLVIVVVIQHILMIVLIRIMIMMVIRMMVMVRSGDDEDDGVRSTSTNVAIVILFNLMQWPYASHERSMHLHLSRRHKS